MVGIHWMVATEVRKSRPRVGSATLTMVASRIVMIDPRTTTAARVRISGVSSRCPPAAPADPLPSCAGLGPGARVSWCAVSPRVMLPPYVEDFPSLRWTVTRCGGFVYQLESDLEKIPPAGRRRRSSGGWRARTAGRGADARSEERRVG